MLYACVIQRRERTSLLFRRLFFPCFLLFREIAPHFSRRPDHGITDRYANDRLCALWRRGAAGKRLFVWPKTQTVKTRSCPQGLAPPLHYPRKTTHRALG